MLIYDPKEQKEIEFWQEGIFRYALSKYLSKSLNFGNLIFVTLSLWEFVDDKILFIVSERPDSSLGSFEFHGNDLLVQS